MKRCVPWIALPLYCLLGGVLLFHLMTEKPTNVIEQKSNFAIIDVSDTEMADALANGEIKIKTDAPNAKALIRVTTGDPTRIFGKVNSNGQLAIINPAGIIVGPRAEFTGGTVIHSTFDTESIIQGKSIEEGNVYAIAVEENGAIEASSPIRIFPETKHGE